MTRLVFQEEAQAALAALWDGGRFPHALLIEGARGSGRRTLALHAASMLLCRGSGQLPCGDCPSCKKLRAGGHPDLTVLVPTGKSQSIGVDAIRQLRLDAVVAPHEAPRRVFLIPDAQALTTQSQNALLKLIEEPPDHAFFILTALSRGALLETIRSRVTALAMQELDGRRRAQALAILRPDADPALLEAAAAAAHTVGEALASLEDKDARQLFSDARALLQFAEASDRYLILALLSGYEKDRGALVRLLEAARSISAANLLRDPDSRLQNLKIAAIIDEMLAAARQNVSIGLLAAVFSGQAVRRSIR